MTAPFRGLLAYVISPMDDDGVVDTDTLGRLVEHAIVPGIAGLGVLGSTGTYAYLDPDQRTRVVRTAVDAAGGRVPVVAGVAALRTDRAMRLAEEAAAAGADGLLMAPQSYTPLSEDELADHYAAVAGTTDLPFCIYSNPSTTGLRISDDLLIRLSEVPTITGIKLPACDNPGAELDRLRPRLPEDFALGYSGDGSAALSLLSGADTFHSVLAGVLPTRMAALAKAAMAGDQDDTDALDATFADVWEIMTRHGSLRVAYAAQDALRLSGAKPPLPIQPIPEDDNAALRAALQKLAA